MPVFVTSVGAIDGFTDPNKDNQDTMKDLRDSLRGYKKEVTVVDKREQALVVLVVQSREKAQGTASVLGPGRDCTVRIKFVFRDTETDMSGSAMGGASHQWRRVEQGCRKSSQASARLDSPERRQALEEMRRTKNHGFSRLARIACHGHQHLEEMAGLRLRS